MKKNNGWVSIALAATLVASVVVTLIFNFVQNQFDLKPERLAVSPRDTVSYLLLCLAIGGLTMACVQVARTLIPLKGYFFRHMLMSFLSSNELDFASKSKDLDGLGSILIAGVLQELSAKQAMQEFENRTTLATTGSFGREFESQKLRSYDLPIEQLCGQIHIVFDSALDVPSRFPHFLRCVVGPEGVDSLELIVPQTTEPQGGTVGDADSQMLKVAEARAFLSQVGQQNIDKFQIVVGGEWRRLLRSVVFFICMLCSWILIQTPINNDALVKAGFWKGVYLIASNVIAPVHIAQFLILGPASAYVAMLLRDLTAIVEGRRRQ